MENDWQKLGDVVARIVARTEEVMTDLPPVPAADALLFVRMLRTVYEPAPRSVAGRTEGQDRGDGRPERAG
jgi:hypothetical protein